jgi:uncharacterized membrane protein YfcA
MLEGFDFVLIAAAAVAAGAINALAGGGTLITFPMLTAVGVPAIAANVTNTVALLPGYLGATLAQRADLRGQEHRLWWAIPAGVAGGLIGGILLLRTGERLFRDLVPYLILLASGLLALQDPLRKWVVRLGNRRTTSQAGDGRSHERWAALPVGLAAIYGGYFGAGLSVIILAVLAVVLDDNLTRLNALKQAVAFATNTAAAIFFLFSGQVVWLAAAVMMGGALLGGVLGGKVAGRIKPAVLRYLVVAIGMIVSIIYFVR